MLPPLVIPNNWPALENSYESPNVSPISPVESVNSQDDLEYARADIHEMEWADMLASVSILEEDDDGP
jgi:hypothetical protein